MGEERGRGFLPVTCGTSIFGRRMSAAHVLQKSICPNTTHSCSVHRVQSSGWNRHPLSTHSKRSGVNAQLPCPLTCTSPPPDPTGAAGLKDASSWSSGSFWESPLQEGLYREGQWEAGVFLDGKSEHSHLLPAHLNLRQKSRKQAGKASGLLVGHRPG